MPEASDTFGMIHQNLIDAGCDAEMTETCMTYIREGKKADMLRLLSRHKERLLKTVRQGQKEIDCLDFLTYRLEKDDI